MSWEAWFTIAIVIACFFALAFTRWAADVVLMGGLTLLLVLGIVSPSQALAGFSNEGMITVAILFVVSAALKETGAIHWLANILFGKPRSVAHAQTRVMAPVAVMSAVLNNTPVVAMMIPALTDWAKKYQLSPSKLLIPLSYAAIVGGTCTLIGTSTNLVINGMVKSETTMTDGLGMFELAWIGIPCVLVTLVYVLIASKWLLPERKPVINYADDVRQYVIEMMVEANSPLVGKSIEDAGLRNLPGAYLGGGQIDFCRRGGFSYRYAENPRPGPGHRSGV
jgi:di/tricarboxylate transporter